MGAAPLPSSDLARRVGVLDQQDPLPSFDGIGRESKRLIVGSLPDGWFDGKRILDFGCGPGKALRHFLPEAEQGCEFFGCDIHEPSIRWVQENLSPPFKAFVCSETPPLPFPDEHLDLVWAMSVFTHLTDHWSDWLLELHRILRPDGRLIATFLGEGMSESIAGEPWNEERVGMNLLRAWQPWDHGGPSVQHSEWWLREHWGRAFDIEQIRDGANREHGWIVLCKRQVRLTRENLIAPSADPRELTALAHNGAQVAGETVALAQSRDALAVALGAMTVSRDTAWDRLRVITESHSWRLTSPLRRLRQRVGQALQG